MADNKPPIVDADIGLHVIPPQASDYAAQVDYLYYGLLGLSAVLIIVLIGLVVVFGWRYQHDRKNVNRAAVPRRAQKRIELAFILGLGALFVGTFYWGAHLYMAIYGERDADITINVVGKQWMWKAQHPDGTREINTLHAPIGETIQIRLTSQDVVHSFYVPALRLKRDAVPGMYTTAYFKATKAGEYRLFCAEYCGLAHSRMRGRVVLMTPEDYQQWLSRNGTSDSPEVAGKRLFESYGCGGCHMSASVARAPSLDGIYGRTVPLENGGTVVADDAYLHDSIVQPLKHVVAGFAPVMPSFEGQIPEGEIFEIIAYIKSLKPGDWRQDDAEGAQR